MRTHRCIGSLVLFLTGSGLLLETTSPFSGSVAAQDTTTGSGATISPEPIDDADANGTATMEPSDGTATTEPSDRVSDESSSGDDAALDDAVRAKFQRAPDGRVILGDYLVAFNKTRVAEVKEAIKEFLDERGINVTEAYEYLRYAKLRILERFGNGTTVQERYISIIKRILASSLVLFVEEDQKLNISQGESSNFTVNQGRPTWGLDRIDQTNLPLNGQYYADSSGEGVTAFILDTGVLPTHVEFEGRASCPYSAIDGEACTDGNGHGTHVAGTIGGTTYGVAKKVNVVGIKVLSNEGMGSNSAVMDGINYILTQKRDNPDALYVVNLSLGGGISPSLDGAINDLIAAGVFVAVAAGNEDLDACGTSPARIRAAVTVGSTDRNDVRSSFSNWGSCVNLFAPGSSITSSWYTSNTATNTISGTSMATPHVAGAAALYLSTNGFMPPSQLFDQLINDATNGTISDTKGSPNLLLNTESLFATVPAAPPSSGWMKNALSLRSGSTAVLTGLIFGMSMLL